jgi:PKD repeat protein
MKKLVLFLMSIGIYSVLMAQIQGDFKKCGTVEAVTKALEEHPELIRNMEQLDRETKEYLMGQDKALDSTLSIPVVFHVIHTYGAERISEAQIKDCIRIMNEDFLNRNADSNSVSAAFRPIVGRPQIRFRLAKKSPTGRCTKGINYLESTLHTQGGENLKSLISWDTKRYLNIWVCSDIASGAAAYAYYPGTAPGQNNEGIVSRDDYVGSIGTSSPGYAARTLTHEIGHYFNLPHTWGNSNQPGLASNCNIDDGVDDTPNCVGVTGSSCNLNQISCGSLDNVENHMEYSSCRRMFTQGQANRMHAAIKSSVGFRSSLWKGPNLVFTGTTNDGPGPECPPTPDFKASLRRACPGQSVTFTQLAYNVDNPNAIQFQWTFTGGTPETSTAKNPSVFYSLPGSYPVKLVVSNSAGSDSLVRTNYLVIQAQDPGYQVGETEGFESSTFPLFPGQGSKNWEIQNSGSAGWTRNLNAAATGSASLRVVNGTTFSGSVTTLFSPVYQIIGSNAGARVNFKYAFARRATTNTDRLQISYSTNCGVSWTSLFNKTGAPLSTVANTINNLFLPAASDWKQESIVMNFLGSAQDFRLRFVFSGGGGNTIYLDDIMISTVTAVSNFQDENLSLNLYPNPSEGFAQVLINSSVPEKTVLEIWDVTGRNCLLNQEVGIEEGTNLISLDRYMTKPKAGSYWVRMTTGKRVMVRQWIVLP